mgnify:CR=1 FL=1
MQIGPGVLMIEDLQVDLLFYRNNFFIMECKETTYSLKVKY